MIVQSYQNQIIEEEVEQEDDELADQYQRKTKDEIMKDLSFQNLIHNNTNEEGSSSSTSGDQNKSQLLDRDLQQPHDEFVQPEIDLSKYVSQQNELNKSVSIGLQTGDSMRQTK